MIESEGFWVRVIRHMPYLKDVAFIWAFTNLVVLIGGIADFVDPSKVLRFVLGCVFLLPAFYLVMRSQSKPITMALLGVMAVINNLGLSFGVALLRSFLDPYMVGFLVIGGCSLIDGVIFTRFRPESTPLLFPVLFQARTL